MSDKRDKYGYCLTFTGKHPHGLWLIYEVAKQYEIDDKSEFGVGGIVATFPDEGWDGQGPPPKVRAEYERLIEYDASIESPAPFNIVEMIASDEDGGFDQPCIYGSRCEGHAVYCHNTAWLYSPRKCRRTWYTGGETRDEDCEGFKPNPAYVAQPNS